MSLKDINLDKTGEVIILDGDICTDSYSQDNIFWRLRNTLIKVFTKKTTFWNSFKGIVYMDKYGLEIEIGKSMVKELYRIYPDEVDLMFLRIEVLILESVAYIFAFRIQPFQSEDDLLIDFSIKL